MLLKSFFFTLLENYGWELRKNNNLQKNEVAFLHIGKCAGTQIINICKKINNKKLNVRKLEHSKTLKHIKKNKYFFSIRNPITRYISGFYNRKNKNNPGKIIQWNEHEKMAFKEFKNANDLAESLFKKNQRGFRALSAIKSIGHINKNQCDTFKDASFLEIKPPIHIIRVEFLTDDLNKLFSKLNIQIDAAKLISRNIIKSHNGKQNTNKVFSQLSNLAKKNLNKWYSQDIEFYNYCCEWIKRN